MPTDTAVKWSRRTDQLANHPSSNLRVKPATGDGGDGRVDLGEPEVGYFGGPSVVKENVQALQIPMYDPASVQEPQALFDGWWARVS